MAQKFYVTIQGGHSGNLQRAGIRAREGQDPGGGVLLRRGVSQRRRPVGCPPESASTSPLSYKRMGRGVTADFPGRGTNETLKSVLFEFISTNSLGKEEVDYTVELTNATHLRV